MKLFKFALTATFALSASAHAAVYKCEEGGQTVFSDQPCGQTAEKVEIRNESKRSKPKSKGWHVQRSEDDMTGTTSCVAMSPTLYLGMDGSDPLFATLRVVTSDVGYVAGVRSEPSAGSRAPSIHNNIDGLGLKVGESEFREFQLSHGSYFVGFEPNTSGQIVEELRQADYFKVRLRFWPYDETYDSGEMTARGFPEALEEVQACEQEG